MDKRGVSGRVLVVDDDDVRAASTCALLERAGYLALTATCPNVVGDFLDDATPTVVLLDISAPGAGRQMSTRHAAIASAVADRCPIVLYGDRTAARGTVPPSSADEAPPAHVRDGLLDLLMGLLPDPSPHRLAESSPPEESERPTTPITF